MEVQLQLADYLAQLSAVLRTACQTVLKGSAAMAVRLKLALVAAFAAMRNSAVERRIMVKTHREARETQTGVAPTLQSSVEPPSVATRLDPRSAYAQLCQPSTGVIAALSAGIPQPAEKKKKKKVPAELDNLQMWQRRTPWQPAEYLGQRSAVLWTACQTVLKGSAAKKVQFQLADYFVQLSAVLWTAWQPVLKGSAAMAVRLKLVIVAAIAEMARPAEHLTAEIELQVAVASAAA